MQHKKNFDYNQVYKYRLKHDPKNHESLKKDKIKYYKEQQKKQEEGKKKLDLLESLIDDGIFEKDDVESILNNKNFPTDINNLENSDEKKRILIEKKEIYKNKQKNIQQNKT